MQFSAALKSQVWEPSLTMRYLTAGTVVSKYRIYSNKRRIWDKKVNKRRLRISAAPALRRLFEEFRITRKNTINCSTTTKEFALVIMKLLGFFHRVNFSCNSRFTISLVSVNRKINR